MFDVVRDLGEGKLSVDGLVGRMIALLKDEDFISAIKGNSDFYNRQSESIKVLKPGSSINLCVS